MLDFDEQDPELPSEVSGHRTGLAKWKCSSRI